MKTWEEKIDISEEQWQELLLDKEVIKEEDFAFLKLIYYSHNNMATGAQVARILEMNHHGPLNLQVGRMSKRIIEKINIDAPKRKDGSNRWWHVPFLGMQNNEGFYWILRPELKAALDEVLETREWLIFPDEIKDEALEFLFEGAKKQVYVNAYERNPTARKKCISYYGCKCAICGFNFIATYGEIGENTIHVHHKKPLSEISDQYIVDPIKDLIPVCPNCHLIMHKRIPPYTMEEVKEMLERNNNNK